MGVKISNLPAIVTPALSDVFPVVQAGVTYKETITQLSALLSGSGALVTQAEVQQQAFNFAASTGVDDAFVVTLDPVPAALTDGMLVTMYSGTLQNLTDSATLNVNGLGAKPIVNFSGTLSPEDIEAGSVYLFIYNAANDNFQLINPFITTADTFFVQQNSYNYAIDAGVANAYVVTLVPDNAGVIDGGMFVIMRASHSNTTASTITVNGTTRSIVNNAGVALSGGEIIASQVYYLLYDDSSSKFVLTNSSTNVTGTVSAGLINQLAYYAAAGSTVSGLATANSGMLVTSGAGVPSISALSAGQIFIGTTGAAPTAAAINSGTGIVVANASGSITVNATGGGFATVSVAGTTQAAAVSTKYILLNSGQTTVTLPSTYAVGDVVALVGSTANTGGWILTANTGDTIRVNNSTTSAGGTVTCTAVAGQCIEVTCDVANTSWIMTNTSSVLLTTA